MPRKIPKKIVKKAVKARPKETIVGPTLTKRQMADLAGWLLVYTGGSGLALFQPAAGLLVAAALHHHDRAVGVDVGLLGTDAVLVVPDVVDGCVGNLIAKK